MAADDDFLDIDIELTLRRRAEGTEIEYKLTVAKTGYTAKKTDNAQFPMQDAEIRRAIRKSINWCLRSYRTNIQDKQNEAKADESMDSEGEIW